MNEYSKIVNYRRSRFILDELVIEIPIHTPKSEVDPKTKVRLDSLLYNLQKNNYNI